MSKIRFFLVNAFDYIKRLSLKFILDGCPIMASSIAFYFLFSVFPLILIFISLSGIFIDRLDIQTTILGFVEERIPIIYSFTESNIEKIIENRASIGIIGFIFLAIIATYVFDSIQFSLNRVYRTKSQRRYWKQKIFGFLIITLTFIIIFLSFLLSTALFYLTNTVIGFFDLNESLSTFLLRYISIFLGLLLNFAIFGIVYFFGTNRKTHFKHHIYKGALIAAFLWEISKHIFIFFINRFANFEMAYGSIGSIIGFLLWIYISSYIFLIGAEVNSLDITTDQI
jgi:membrane protein